MIQNKDLIYSKKTDRLYRVTLLKHSRAFLDSGDEKFDMTVALFRLGEEIYSKRFELIPRSISSLSIGDKIKISYKEFKIKKFNFSDKEVELEENEETFVVHFDQLISLLKK